MEVSAQQKKVFYILFSLIGLSLFVRLGSYPLYMEEPRRALIALEMFLSGDWLNPTIHGEPYYRKPPLYNWIIAGFITLFQNTDEWVVRLTSVLSFLGLGFVHFRISQQLFSAKIAFWSTLILLTLGDLYLYFSRLAEMDLFFALLAYPSILLPVLFAKQKKWWQFFLLPPFLAGLAFMAKGIPAIAFVGISYLVVLALTNEWKQLWSIKTIAAILIFSLPVSVYLLAYSSENDLTQFLEILLSESTNRTGSGFKDFFIHLLTFPFDTLKNLLPYSLMLVLIKRSIWKDLQIRMLILLFGANFLLYWLAPGGRGRYIYPIMPIAALVLAYIGLIQKEKIMTWIQGRMGLIANRLLLVLGFIPIIFFFPPWFSNFNFSVASVTYLVFARFFFLKWKILNLWLPFVLLIHLKLCLMISSPLLVEEHVYLDKQMGVELYEEFKNKRLYYNTNVEKHFTMVYELTRLKGQVIDQDNSYADEDGIYIVLKPYRPIGEFITIKEFSLGSTDFLMLQPNASKE